MLWCFGALVLWRFGVLPTHTLGSRQRHTLWCRGNYTHLGVWLDNDAAAVVDILLALPLLLHLVDLDGGQGGRERERKREF